MTKKKIALISFLGVILFSIFVFSREVGICPSYSYSGCAYLLDALALIVFPAIPLFLFSLITYFMREEVFQAWWRFARIATLVSMLLILIAPSYSHDWMFPIEKGNVAFFTALVFVLVSIIVIIRTRTALRGE